MAIDHTSGWVQATQNGQILYVLKRDIAVQ